MKIKKRVLMIAVILITALIFLEYALSPYIDAYRINRHLDIGGAKLLMTPSQVEELLGKGSPIGGFGAGFYEYDNSAVMVAYPWEGMLKGKAGQFDIKDPKYSICGVRPGDSSDKAAAILRKYGFTRDKNNKYIFRRGSVRIYSYGDLIRIDMEDWTIKGHVY